MEPSTLTATPTRAGRRRKPPAIWVLITFLAGAAGSLGAVAALGTGTYNIEPFVVQLSAKPFQAGTTQFAVRKLDGIPATHYEAATHSAPIAFRATVTNVTSGFLTSDAKTVATPKTYHDFLTDEGKTAVRNFALKLAGIALAGGAAAGAALSFVGMRWRRVIGAALSGLLVFAALGVWVQQSYDSNKLITGRWVLDETGTPVTGTLPTIVPS